MNIGGKKAERGDQGAIPMNAAEIVVLGSVKPDGSLELDEKLQLPAGRVQVTVQAVVESTAPKSELVGLLAAGQGRDRGKRRQVPNCGGD